MQDDASEWNAIVTERPTIAPKIHASLPGLNRQEYAEEKASLKGATVQYAAYKNGYAATSHTISNLPPGVYDLASDSACVYVVPSLPPSGLLLELPEMSSEIVLNQVTTFWNSEKDYKEGNEFVVGGTMFKAGIMIYGPPGSGKSCTIKLVTKKIVEKGGIAFYGKHPFELSDFLTSFAKIENERKSVVVLEDIDSLIDSYGEAGYLEILDSAKTINNVLFIATTNYPEKLDPRVYNRPGRFSHVIKIGLPSAKTREAYLKAILKNHRDIAEIVDNSQGFTIDHLTALINAVYREKKELKSEIKRLRTLFNVPKADDKQLGIGINVEEE